MESCRVPIELCEAIIETLPIRTIASTRGDYYVGLQAQRTLRACALTCRAWRVRAQLNLWVSPHLESEHYLALFAATLRTGPKPLITNLWLHQSTFVRSTELFMHIFPNLRNVTCSKVDFNHGPPLSILRMRLPFFAGVTVLRIVHCRFHSLRAMMDMVWAFPNLSELELSFFTFKFAPLPAAGGRVDLSAICGHLRSCQKLARLKLIIPATPAAEDVPPPFTAAAFGHAAIELVVGPYYTSNHLGRFLRPDSFPSLRLISILARPSSYDRGVPWLHAIVACRAVPWMLERIVIEYGHDWRREEHACCQEVVGASEEVAGSPQRLPELVSGLKELTIRFDQREAPRRCGAYILSVLPNMRKVLRFEYSPLETDCWEEYTLPVAR